MFPAVPSAVAPDLCGEGDVVCPCGEYRLVWPGGWRDLRAAVRVACPNCHLVLEVWRKP